MWLGVSFVFGKGIQLLTQVLMARLLAPGELGLWAMVLVVHVLAGLFRDTAIAQVLVQRGLKDRERVDAVYSLGVNVSLLLTLMQAVAGYPLAQFLGLSQLWPLAAWVGIVHLIGAGAGTHGAVLQRQLRFRELALCDLASALWRTGVSLTAALLGVGVWAFVLGEWAAALSDALLKRRFSGYHFHYHLRPDPSVLKGVQSFIGGLLAVNLAVLVNTSSDNLVIGRLLGPTALGYYALAYQLAMVPVIAVSHFNRLHFAVLVQRDRMAQGAYLAQSLELYALAGAPVFALAWLTAPWGLPLLLGPTWSQAVPVMQWVLVFAYARGFMSLLGTALNALDRPGVNALINWVLVPLALPAYALGALSGGIVGVAMAAALVMGIGATGWFWWATCRSAVWPVGLLSAPVVWPTASALVSLLVAQYTPVSIQPLVLLGLYLALVMGQKQPLFAGSK